MGLLGAISHFAVKYLLKVAIIWFGLMFLVGIPQDKIGTVLLIVGIAEVASFIIASLLLMQKRGY